MEKKTTQEESLELQQRIAELHAERERLINEKKEIWNQIVEEMKSIPVALQLHLELDFEECPEEAKETLRKYGKMEESISRDLMVPGRMSLHALHYAIMRAFGWQNNHLHSYEPYPEEFARMTDGSKVSEWTRQVGMYFRFPSEDLEDIYWDDDYEEGENIKTWLKSKYCGPYSYEGNSEHYLPSQIEVEDFRKHCPQLQNLTTDQSTWNVHLDGACEQLLERLAIWKVLKTPDNKMSWDTWREQKESILEEAEANRKLAMKRYKKLSEKMDDIAAKASRYMDEEGYPTQEMAPYITEMIEKDAEQVELCVEHNPEIVPCLTSLRYRYDFGDSWEIRITCTNAWFNRSIYAYDEEGSLIMEKGAFVKEEEQYLDAFGQKADEEFAAKLKEFDWKEKPVCIGWDCLNVMDDVGGIRGYCEFLQTINGNDKEEKQAARNWAKAQGWTGRMAKTANIL